MLNHQIFIFTLPWGHFIKFYLENMRGLGGMSQGGIWYKIKLYLHSIFRTNQFYLNLCGGGCCRLTKKFLNSNQICIHFLLNFALKDIFFYSQTLEQIIDY